MHDVACSPRRSVGLMQYDAFNVDPDSGTRLEADAPAGVSTRAASTLLVERAADFLRAGPASSRDLVSTVCQLSALPPAIAEHMAVTLLRDHPRFIRTADGGWRLGESAPPAWRVASRDEEPLLSELSFATGRCSRGSRPGTPTPGSGIGGRRPVCTGGDTSSCREPATTTSRAGAGRAGWFGGGRRRRIGSASPRALPSPRSQHTDSVRS